MGCEVQRRHSTVRLAHEDEDEGKGLDTDGAVLRYGT